MLLVGRMSPPEQMQNESTKFQTHGSFPVSVLLLYINIDSQRTSLLRLCAEQFFLR